MNNPVSERILRAIPRVGVALILGSEGSGKSNLAYGILESLRTTGRRLLVYGLPIEKAIHLPDWIGVVHSLDFPEDSIVLADEAYLALPSRKSMSAGNQFMDIFSGLVRQKDILGIFVSQFSRKLDIGVVSTPRVLLFKQPSLLQMRFDRSELRPVVAAAATAFTKIEQSPFPKGIIDQVDGIKAKMTELGADTEVSPRCLIATYVLSNKFEGMVDPSNTSPSFWSTELSKAWKGVSLFEWGNNPSAVPNVNEWVRDRMEESSVGFGKCLMCGKEGPLRTDVCESCFVVWATSVYERKYSK